MEKNDGEEYQERTYSIVTRSVARKQLLRLQRSTRPRPVIARKRFAGGDAGVTRRRTRLQSKPGLMLLPREIHLEILKYLGAQDLHALRKVSTYFERIVRDPTLWKDYEISNNEMSTADVINDLKRMPLLKKIYINSRIDCDDILRQISLSNKNLEELYIFNCIGSSLNLYLRPAYLTRILERCRRLHTINVYGARFRGLKFYRLLGEVVGPRLRALLALSTPAQFETFARHLTHVAEKDRELIGSISGAVARNDWAYVQYNVSERKEQPNVILISYYLDTTNLACLQLQSVEATGTTANASSSA